MPVMTAAAMTALAKGKNKSANKHDATTKMSLQQRVPRTRPPPPPLVPKVEPKQEPKVESLSPAPQNYTDYQLWSRPDDPHAYSVIKFRPPNSSFPVDLEMLRQPIKLNRKNPKSKTLSADGDALATPAKDIKWKPLKGADGREVIGKDGKVVMAATIDGKEVLQANYGKEKPKTEEEKKKKSAAFKKKTRQVFTAPDAIRQLRREERFPWLLEPDGDKDSWTGKMTDQNEDGIYAFFVANSNGGGGFSFIPVHRCYDFVKTSTHAASMTSEEAEAKYAYALKKNSLVVQFAARGGGSASAATLATLNAAEASASSSTKSGVKKEDDDMAGGLFGDDDEDVKKEDIGAEGAYDEMEFEEEHADDEDTMDPEDVDDEETKDSKARIKREQIAANKTMDGGLDDSDGEAEGVLTGEGKRMKKVLGKVDQAYDSDDDDMKNPYASSEEEEEEIIPEAPRQESTNGTSTPPSRTTPKPRGPTTNKTLKAASTSGSRANSPGVSGSAQVALRAVSPTKKSTSRAGTPVGKRASSPLVGGAGSRAGSPVVDGARSGSPLATGARVHSSATSGRAASPFNNAGPSKAASPPVTQNGTRTLGVTGTPSGTKRKAPEDASSATTDPASVGPTKKKSKKRDVPASFEPFEGMLPDSVVIEFLRQHPDGVESKRVVAHCKAWLSQAPANRTVLTEIVKRVGETRQDANGFFVKLKPGL